MFKFSDAPDGQVVYECDEADPGFALKALQIQSASQSVPIEPAPTTAAPQPQPVECVLLNHCPNSWLSAGVVDVQCRLAACEAWPPYYFPLNRPGIH